MMAKIDKKDNQSYEDDLLCMCALRYAIGRKTLIVGAVIAAIERRIPTTSPQQRALYVRDIDDHKRWYEKIGRASCRERVCQYV